MWLKYTVSVFRRFSTRYFGICHFFLRYCGIGYPPMSPSVYNNQYSIVYKKYSISMVATILSRKDEADHFSRNFVCILRTTTTRLVPTNFFGLRLFWITAPPSKLQSRRHSTASYAGYWLSSSLFCKGSFIVYHQGEGRMGEKLTNLFAWSLLAKLDFPGPPILLGEHLNPPSPPHTHTTQFYCMYEYRFFGRMQWCSGLMADWTSDPNVIGLRPCHCHGVFKISYLF